MQITVSHVEMRITTENVRVFGLRTGTKGSWAPLAVGLAPPHPAALITSLAGVGHHCVHAEVVSRSNGICDVAWISA